MAENIKNLADDQLERVGGGTGEMDGNEAMQTMICLDCGHEWETNLSALETDPQNAFLCPECGSTNVRRKD